MINLLRPLKGLSPLILLILMALLIVSCQSESGEPHIDLNAELAPEPVSPSTEEYTLPLTPIDELGITGIAQDVDINEYRLTVTGLVENTLSLTYHNILEYLPVTEIGVIDCPGYFLDVAEWTGVPLTTLLEEAGTKSEASQATFYAIDGYQQTLSLEHVDKYDVFLAYRVNGQTLPPEHGFPLRVVDNGSIGSAWVKWLQKIKVE